LKILVLILSGQVDQYLVQLTTENEDNDSPQNAGNHRGTQLRSIPLQRSKSFLTTIPCIV